MKNVEEILEMALGNAIDKGWTEANLMAWVRAWLEDKYREEVRL